MNAAKSVSYREIIMFDTQSELGPNALKQFLYYLKFKGKKGVINFSFASGISTLHTSLSIKENLILDAVTNRLIKEKDDDFALRISQNTNKSLDEMIKALGDLDKYPEKNDLALAELASLTKAILSDSEYIFILINESVLNENLIQTIKDAILFEVQTKNRKVFLQGQNQDKWLDIATDFVTKDDKHIFVKARNKLCQLSQNVIDFNAHKETKTEKVSKKQENTGQYSFTLNKKSA